MSGLRPRGSIECETVVGTSISVPVKASGGEARRLARARCARGARHGIEGRGPAAFGLRRGAARAAAAVVGATLIGGLPYPDPQRLVQVTMTKGGAFDEMVASYPTFLDWKAQSASFQFLAGYGGSGGTTRFGSEPPRAVESAVVTADFFRALGDGARIDAGDRRDRG